LTNAPAKVSGSELPVSEITGRNFIISRWFIAALLQSFSGNTLLFFAIGEKKSLFAGFRVALLAGAIKNIFVSIFGKKRE
jgi:hypothetical protein